MPPCPQTIFLLSATGSGQQLGFQPRSPPRPHSRLRRRQQHFSFLSTRAKAARARSPRGHRGQVEPPGRRTEPFPGGTGGGPPPRPGLRGSGARLLSARPERRGGGCAGGVREELRGFSRGREATGEAACGPPAHGGAREVTSRPPNPPSRSCPNPSQVADPSRSPHRLGFCVLGSGALTPHHPAEEIHLVAQPPALPAPSGKER